MPRVPFREGTTPEQQQAIRDWQEAEAKRRAEQHQLAIDNAVRDLEIPALESLWNTEVSRACHRDGPSFGTLRNLDKLTTAAAARCAALGLSHQHLRKFRILVTELSGPSSIDRSAFGHTRAITQIRAGAAAEIGDLRLRHETDRIEAASQKAVPAASEERQVAPAEAKPALTSGSPVREHETIAAAMPSPAGHRAPTNRPRRAERHIDEAGYDLLCTAWDGLDPNQRRRPTWKQLAEATHRMLALTTKVTSTMQTLKTRAPRTRDKWDSISQEMAAEKAARVALRKK